MDALTEKNTVSFQEKSIIFRENDFSRDMYLLKSGRVCLFKKIGNKNVLLTEIESGSILGELSLIDGGPRSATAVAVKTTRALKISPSEYREIVRGIPEWFLRLARILAERLRATDKKLLLTGPKVNEANVTAILLYLFRGMEHPEQGISSADAEKYVFRLLRISVSEWNGAIDVLVQNRLLAEKSGRLFPSSVEDLEQHLSKIRRSLSTTTII